MERLAVALILLVVPAGAAAQDAGTPSPQADVDGGVAEPTGAETPTGSHYVAPHVAPYRAAPAGEVREDDFTHKNQFGLRLGVGVNAFFAIKTAHGPPCDGIGAETFCRGVGVGIIDADMAYGVSDGLELTILGQFGMTSDPTTGGAHPHTSAIVLAAGIRLYPSPHDRVKPFFAFRAAVKFVDAIIPSFSQWDVGVRGEGGLIVEITRAVGLYAQVAVSIFFVNDFTIPFDFTGGAQVRFP